MEIKFCPFCGSNNVQVIGYVMDGSSIVLCYICVLKSHIRIAPSDITEGGLQE